MSGLPQLVTLGRIAGPAEIDAAAFRRDLCKLLRLQGRRLFGAVELHEQRRFFRVVQAGIGIAGPHLHFIKQFDARNRNTHLDRHDNSVTGRLNTVEGADATGDLFRDALQPQRNRGQNPKRALGADESRVRS